jgi:Flp pilus assembly pilin Flp
MIGVYMRQGREYLRRRHGSRRSGEEQSKCIAENKEENMNTLRRFFKDERGIELSEYVVALGLILVVAFVVIGLLGNQITRIFQLVVTKLEGVQPA